MKTSLLLALAILCLASNSFAGGKEITDQYIEEIGVVGSGHLIVKLTGTQAEFDNLNYIACTEAPSAEFEFILNPQSPMLKEMYATALSAKNTNQKVYVWISGCVNVWNGFLVRPKITAIKIIN